MVGGGAGGQRRELIVLKRLCLSDGAVLKPDAIRTVRSRSNMKTSKDKPEKYSTSDWPH